MKLLQGKVALVTGATRGIGRAIALKFAENGANVAFTYLSSSAAAESLVAEIEALGCRAAGYASNIISLDKQVIQMRNFFEKFNSSLFLIL